MINIKVDNEQSSTEGKTTKNARTDPKKGRGFPKNIRQVGDIPHADRVYIEDYVVTYLNQLAHPANRIAKGAILLGEWSKEGKKDILFINGAVEADNLSFDMKEIVFTNETWSSVHQKIEDNFPGEQVVGWFLSRLGYSVSLDKEIEDCHKVNFKGDKTVLYLMDALEQEDAFYLFDKGTASRLPGYYIYYERNTPMQEYLIAHHAQYSSKQDEDRTAYKDSQVLHSYHEIMAGRRARKEQKQVTRLLYVTSAMLTLVFLALGITVFNNYDRIKRIQSALEFLSDETSNTQENAIADSDSNVDLAQSTAHTNALGAEVGTQNEDANKEENVQTNASETQNAELQNEVSETGNAVVNENKPETQQQNTSTTVATGGEGDTSNAEVDNGLNQNASAGEEKNTGEVLQATSSNVANYYTVQNGDTLLSICQKVYHSDAYVELVKQANELENGDVIYPGQQIVLPSID